jgi:hypothetical protein
MEVYKLNEKQRRFVALYEGDPEDAAEFAGFTRAHGYALLRNPAIVGAIQNRNALRVGILTREQRQRMWSGMAMDVELDPVVRLKASEMLAKSECDFVEKVDLKVNIALADQIRMARMRALASD